MSLSDATLDYIETIKGFMDPDEGSALHDMALEVISDFPNSLTVEIGSYCGKSTVYIGNAVRQRGGLMVSVDHHYGSEENQPGEAYFDPDLADIETGGMSSLAAAARYEALIWKTSLFLSSRPRTWHPISCTAIFVFYLLMAVIPCRRRLMIIAFGRQGSRLAEYWQYMMFSQILKTVDARPMKSICWL